MKIFLVAIIIIIVVTEAKVLIIIDPFLNNCTKYNTASTNDLSKLDFIPINDTLTILNGTWRFARPLQSPWPMHVYTEHYIQGQWLIQGYDRQYKDFCQSIKNLAEPWYYVTKNLKKCPLPEGTEWSFDMVPLKFSPILLNSIPRHYLGRWRLNMDGDYKEDGTVKNDCRRVYGDVFED